MIDTIKFKVLVKKEVFEIFKRFSIETKRTNNISGEIEFDYINPDVNVGSFSYKVNIQCHEVNDIETLEDLFYVCIEFSVPKILSGHNVFLLKNNQQIEEGVKKVYKAIVEKIGDFPPYKDQWKIIRLDLCYSWKLNNDDEVAKILTVFKSYKYLGFRPVPYPTSIMFVGKTYSLKYYMKHTEFKRHDFQRLVDIGKSELAYKLLDWSTGVLRCEVSMKSPLVKYVFGDNLTLKKLLSYNLENPLENQLNYYHSKFIKMDTTTTGIAEVYKLLIDKFGKSKGRVLYQFYRVYFSDIPLDRQVLIENYSRSQIYQSLKDIKDAGVGIVIGDNKFSLDLDIPSDLEVNKVVAGAQARQLH